MYVKLQTRSIPSLFLPCHINFDCVVCGGEGEQAQGKKDTDAHILVVCVLQQYSVVTNSRRGNRSSCSRIMLRSFRSNAFGLLIPGACTIRGRHLPVSSLEVTVGFTRLTSARALFSATHLLWRRQHGPTNVLFQLDALPPNLQREFHKDENAVNLTYLVDLPSSKIASSHEDSSDGTTKSDTKSPVIKVLPTWAHIVTWCCATCGCQWSARPVDRTDPQVAAFYSCPRCAARTAKKYCSDTPLAVSPSTPSFPPGRRFAEAFPLLAAQWDACRNSVIHNKVLFESVADVPLPCATIAWWSCPHCGEPWRESVNSRVQRLVQQQQKHSSNGNVRSNNTCIPLCPSCEDRGLSLTVPKDGNEGSKEKSSSERRSKKKGNQNSELKRFLKDSPLLLAEAQLQPHEDPGTIALRSNKLVCWKCRRCTYEFVASVADRFLRYKRCPQCTGEKRTPLNLLSIQRPDVLREIARTVVRGKLLKMTVHDDTVVPFVCRSCLSIYRMPIRLRCLLPEGTTACSKCMWSRSKFTREVVSVGKGQKGAPFRSPPKKKRGRDSYAVVDNELHLRDTDLMN
ncbi:hypothetical protein, conserved [Trypanosoma brucei gambiense DAL972]|uniref:Treble clef zinc finger domain-containing protein n=1 Tax=Trypanosoma brucei gambiense (strain MHOM/CI/86/DAL972) TaxID=679716 RepID=C9ZTN9_TRYB9|nr:hypothetical protein, conserved [Trypanosoma brucei gambiense DAL972]CBH12774.1 hypothetical protein, conserved [Trypanosoma brucei gambiense DAL972]|eukprot:XP_011775054.1 hypothetical protein, conserved [Trypanosoma brucei gambiense DAL972]